MKFIGMIPVVITILALAASSYAQGDERLYGVWKMTQYTRQDFLPL